MGKPRMKHQTDPASVVIARSPGAALDTTHHPVLHAKIWRMGMVLGFTLISHLCLDVNRLQGQMTAAQFNELRYGSRAPYRDETAKFQAYVKNARQLRNENVVMQQRDFSCGAAALATVLNYYWGENVSETALLLIIAKILSREELEDRVLNGLTLTDLKNVAQVGGYTAVLGKLSIEKLGESKLPLVVAITVNDYDHFVVFRGMDDEYVYLADPIYGKKKEKIETFQEQWQQNAILAVIKPGEPPKENSPLAVKEVEKQFFQQNRQFIQFQLTGRVNP